MFKKIRIAKFKNQYNNDTFQNKNGDLFALVFSENNLENNEDNTTMKDGIYWARNIYEKNVGYLKFTIYPDSKKAELNDIHIDKPYRNTGIGSYLLKKFQSKCMEENIQYIEGKLSSVDEQTEDELNLRNSFYKKHNFKINNKAIKKIIA